LLAPEHKAKLKEGLAALLVHLPPTDPAVVSMQTRLEAAEQAEREAAAKAVPVPVSVQLTRQQNVIRRLEKKLAQVKSASDKAETALAEATSHAEACREKVAVADSKLKEALAARAEILVRIQDEEDAMPGLSVRGRPPPALGRKATSIVHGFTEFLEQLSAPGGIEAFAARGAAVVSRLRLQIQDFHEALEGTDATDMDGDDEGEDGAEEEDEGQATPRAGHGGFQSASSANEGLPRAGPVRRLRPADSLGGHRSRLGTGRTARSRSGERIGGLLPSEEGLGLAPDPKKPKHQSDGLALFPPERAVPTELAQIGSLYQQQAELAKALGDSSEPPVSGLAA
jgi:hypothetical protein